MASPFVLINHTVSGSWKDDIKMRDFLLFHGYNLLMYTRRGHELTNTGGKFSAVGYPEDLQCVLLAMREKYPANRLYLVGCSAGSINNVAWWMKFQSPLVDGVVSVSHVYTYQGFSKLPWWISYAVTRELQDILSKDMHYYNCHYPDNQHLRLLDTRNLDQFVEESFHLYDKSMSFEQAKHNFSNFDWPEADFTKTQNLAPLFFIDALDDPFYDSGYIRKCYMDKFFKTKGWHWIHHRHGGHCGFLQGYLFGKSNYENQVLDILKQLDKTQKINK